MTFLSSIRNGFKACSCFGKKKKNPRAAGIIIGEPYDVVHNPHGFPSDSGVARSFNPPLGRGIPFQDLTANASVRTAIPDGLDAGQVEEADNERSEATTAERTEPAVEGGPGSSADKNIGSVEGTKDFMVPSLWGSMDKHGDPYTPQTSGGCCNVM